MRPDRRCQIAFAPPMLGFAHPALNRAPIDGLGEQGRHLRSSGRDELIALLARFLSLRRELGKISGAGA